MSYSRMGWPRKYFKGESAEYTFHNGEHFEFCSQHLVESEDMVEIVIQLLSCAGYFNDEIEKHEMAKLLAKELECNHKLRDRPLTTNESFKIMGERVKETEKKFKEFFK